MIRKPCCSRFSIHKFVQLKCFWTQFKNVHLQGPCSLRPCISRPYCTSQNSPNTKVVLFFDTKNTRKGAKTDYVLYHVSIQASLSFIAYVDKRSTKIVFGLAHKQHQNICWWSRDMNRIVHLTRVIFSLNGCHLGMCLLLLFRLRIFQFGHFI